MLPGMWLFANDSGPTVYFIDSNNQLAKGRGTVWKVAAGALELPGSRFVASNLAAFLRSLIESG